MEKNTNAGVIEKTETSRRAGKTETKAETIMTMSKKTTRFVTETSDKQVTLEVSKKRELNLFSYSDGDTTKQCETCAQTRPNRTSQFDFEKWQINFCLAKCLTGYSFVGF